MTTRPQLHTHTPPLEVTHIPKRVFFYQFTGPIGQRALKEFLDEHTFDFTAYQDGHDYLGGAADVFIERHSLQKNFQFDKHPDISASHLDKLSRV